MDNKKNEILKRRSKLSPDKQAILEKRLRGEVNSHSRLEIIPKRSQTSPAPLSFAQQRLWFLHQLDPNSRHYIELAYLRLTGALNINALKQSLNEIVRRHEALRTTFEMLDEQAIQVIHPTVTVELPIVNLCLMSEAVRQAQIEQRTAEIAQQPFDLASGPLVRAMLLQTSVEENVLLFAIHQIAVDAWSVGVLIQELAALYEAFSSGKTSLLPELSVQYADFAIWQRQWLEEVLDTQLGYWKQQLEGAKTVLELPIDRPRSSLHSIGTKHALVLSPTLSQSLKSLSQKQGVTLFITLLAAFNTLLYCYTRQEDILVGSPIANRNRRELEGVIGFFVNSLVLRTDLSNNPSFDELLQRVREVALGAYTHQDLPFEKLVAELHLKREQNHNPLFQVWFNLQNTLTPDLRTLILPGLTVSVFEINTIARFDLSLLLSETPQGISGGFEYKTDLFEATTIARMADRFEILLRNVVTQPDIRLNKLVEILDEADRQEQLTKAQQYQNTVLQKLRNVKRKSNSKFQSP